MGDNTSGKANLFWDQSTGQLKLRSGTTEGIILDTDGSLQSGNYNHGTAGWLIDASGNAQFNDIKARGAIMASTFTYENVNAVGGHLLVSKSGSVLYEDFTSPGSLSASHSIKVENSEEDVTLFAVNDILRIQAYDGTYVSPYWGTVTAISAQTGYTTLTVTFNAGSISTTFLKGMSVINYGPSGAGVVDIQAGDPAVAATPTRILIGTHSGSPWGGLTEKVVIGDVYGTYGASTNHRWGFGVGDYSGGNYMSYNAETADTFIVKAGGGAVAMDGDGISITISTDVYYQPAAIDWYYSTNKLSSLYALSGGCLLYTSDAADDRTCV